MTNNVIRNDYYSERYCQAGEPIHNKTKGTVTKTDKTNKRIREENREVRERVMIKIVPWADRKLSMKNWRKIWNLFPYGEICMTENSLDWTRQNWAERVARYYVSRGREFSVEIENPLLCTNFIYNLLLIGVKKFYFHWAGITEVSFISAFEILSYIMSLQ